MARYRTIVADPPWHYERTGFTWLSAATRAAGHPLPSRMPYPTMSVEEISLLPVESLATTDAHLYLWTTQKYLRAAFNVAERWGFKPSTVLVWCKPTRGWLPGGAFMSNLEFVLFCRRGSLPTFERVNSQWFTWPRGRHSAKPEQFQDVVEQVSPGPYLELFARRPRVGWSVWGNEVESDVDLAA